MILKTTLFLLSACIILVSSKNLTPSTFIQLSRPSVPVVSPNGSLAVYTQAKYSIWEAKSHRNLYLLNIDMDYVEELTKPSFETSDGDPFFLDEDNVAYLHQGKDAIEQLYVLNIKTNDRYRLTDFPIPIENIKYHVDGMILAFSAYVYNNMSTLEETLERDKQIKNTKKDSGLVFDQLMVRHWDAYIQDKKNNIFVVKLVKDNNNRYQILNKPLNLLQKTGLESPAFRLGDANDFAISPDGSEIAFVSKIKTRDNAWQTSAHIYTVKTTGKGKPIAINNDISAASSHPYYTPSGLLVYFQMFVPQYEADRNRIVIYNPKTHERRIVANSWELSPQEVTSSPDSETLFVTAEDRGRSIIFAIDLETEEITRLTNEKYATGLSVLPSGNIFYSASSMKHPVTPHLLNISTRQIKQLASEPTLARTMEHLTLSDPQDVWFTGALDEKVHGWYLPPANYKKGKKYPVAFLIHGGPQAAWGDNWSTRWNPQVFAAAGYGVIAINYHGSTGYGQRFTDSMAGHWGSYPLYDLMAGLDYVLDKYPYLDADRVVGVGGSVGGYFINWINGQTDRFKALVNHDGAFSLTSIYYTTDEIYFCEKEFGGTPLNPEDRFGYEKWSPSNFVQNWITPTLVIHGGHDYRLDLSESLSTFQALQRKGVESRFLYFPDEKHWTVKPANSLRWHHEVLDWINKYALIDAASTGDPSLIYQ